MNLLVNMGMKEIAGTGEDALVDRWKKEEIEGWMGGQIDRRLNEQTGRWTDGLNRIDNAIIETGELSNHIIAGSDSPFTNSRFTSMLF